MPMAVTVIIPAHNEATLIGRCLAALLSSDSAGPVQVVVVANGCADATAAVAAGFAAQADARGWALQVLDLPQSGKPGALNAGDRAALYPARVYLDADVTVSPGLLAGLAAVLDQPGPAYASGQLRITAQGRVARAYAAIWRRVPFMAGGVPGCGLFAVNAPGRALWADFPPVISDDTYVRLQFSPGQRHLVPAPYDWPMAEGLAPLVRVRRRQDAGVTQVAALYPGLMVHDATPSPGLTGALRLALSNPPGFAVYAAVAVIVRLTPGGTDWSRGR